MTSSQPSTNTKSHISSSSALKFTISVLVSHGVSPSNAEKIANALVAADLRGVDTHGINRLPSYIERIRQGVLDPRAEPELKQITPVVVKVDGKNGWGFVGAGVGMDACIEMAKIYGIGMASISHSNHFGMAAWLVQRGLSHNLLSLVFTNSSPALPVYGGKEKLMGVSPIACGAPGPVPFILDMAPSIAARGKIYKALRRGEKIPMDWALDGEGRKTDDPEQALKGVMLPMGGPKGSALAVMMDVFSGVLSGSAFAGGVTGPYDSSRPADVGHFLVALRADLFLDGGLEEFKERMKVLYEKIVGSKRAEGVDRIWFPGEIELVTEEERKKNGIPFVKAEIEALNREAEKMGVEKIEVMS